MVARDGDEGRQQDARAREHAQREFERPIPGHSGHRGTPRSTLEATGTTNDRVNGNANGKVTKR